MHTILLAMLTSGRKIDAYWPVEADEHTRSIGNNVTKRLKSQYKAQLAPDFLRPTLPQDIELITEQMVIDISPIHLLAANWSSSDIAGVAADRARAAANSDETRGRLSSVERIRKWVVKHNTTCHFVFESEDFRLQHPDEWKRVTDSFGPPVGMDAALVSYSHRWRLYWTSFFRNDMIPQIRNNLHLNQVLDNDHVARTAIYSDTPPYIPANTEGIMMTRYVTVKRARNTQSIRDGTGLVRKRTATTELEAYERPRIQELERILGFKPGDTDAPELQALPEATRERIRGGALGSGSDARLLTNILEALPRLPGQR